MRISKKLLGILLSTIMLTGFSVFCVVNVSMIVNAEADAQPSNNAEPDQKLIEGEVDNSTPQEQESAETANNTSPKSKTVSDEETQAKETGTEKSSPNAQTDEESQPISKLFPDAELARLVAEALNKTDAQAPVTQAELNTVNKIAYSGNGRPLIQNLEGIQHLKNLAILTLDYHAIQDITPLSSLANLTNLNLRGNKISDIHALRNSSKLRELIADMNDISDIDVLKDLVNITNLNLKHNKIGNIRALASLTNLSHLNMSSNQISDLTPLRPLTNLEDLRLEANNIQDITPLQVLTNLEVLNIDLNYITNLSTLKSLTNLRELYIGKMSADSNENSIADFSVLSALPHLNSLHVQGHGINRVPQDVLHRLQSLDARYSGLTDITPFLALTNLSSLRLDGNNFSDISPLAQANFPKLQDLDLSGNYIIDITPLKSANLPQIRKLNLSDQSNQTTPVLPHSEKITIENMIKDANGNLVAPSRIIPSGKGIYVEPHVVWQIQMPHKQTWVSYYWNERIKLHDISIPYSGTYTVEVYEHYPVNFYIDEQLYTSKNGQPDMVIAAPDDPAKEGYEFSGWYTAAKFGRKWDFATDKMARKSLNLYARFSPLKYIVTFDNEGDVTTEQAAFGSKLKERAVPPKTGYTFAGWYTERNGGSKWDFATRTMPNYDITLFAQYTQNVYNVIFDDAGVRSEAMPVNFGEFIVEPQRPTKNGYKFLGWYTDANGGQLWNFASDKMPANDIVLYARYQKLPTTSEKLVTRARDIILHESELQRIQEQLELEATLIALSDVKVFDEDGNPIYDTENAQFVVINLDELNTVAGAGQYEVRLAYVSARPIAYQESNSEMETYYPSIINSPKDLIDVDLIDVDLDDKELLKKPGGMSTPHLSTEVKMIVLADSPSTPDPDNGGSNGSNTNKGNGSGDNTNNGGSSGTVSPKLPQTGLYTYESIVFSLLLVLSSGILLVIAYLRKKRD